ncbi:MAG: NADPH-dependent FMN reductase [Steroidobacteraceae bacterium]
MKLLAIAGSLRKDSLNTKLARAAAGLAPAGVEVDVATLHGLPMYDEDLRADGIPAPVAQLAARVREADGILIVTPEYNFSVPGALKNALDWLSRLAPPPFAGKSTAIMSASPGMLGGMRAQDHLRQILFGLDARTLTRPQVIVGSAAGKFAPDGSLTDGMAVELVENLLDALASAGGNLHARHFEEGRDRRQPVRVVAGGGVR